MFFGLSVPQIIGLFFVGYLIINAFIFFLDWICHFIACGFHVLLSKFAGYMDSLNSSEDSSDSDL